MAAYHGEPVRPGRRRHGWDAAEMRIEMLTICKVAHGTDMGKVTAGIYRALAPIWPMPM